MKLERLRSIVARGSVPLLQRRGDAEELIIDIDAEIAKARGEHHEGAAWSLMVIRRLEALERGEAHGVASDMAQNGRLSALEAGEVELREHCQGNVPMSVFNDLKKRVESMSEDLSSLENQVSRELSALAERVKALESKPKTSLCDDVMHEQAAEDAAFKAWRSEPWPYGVAGSGTGMMCESAFREGFRAGRK